MKKAKVTKGIVRRVWPWEKTLPDGTKLTKEFPSNIYEIPGKEFPFIVEVPDDVQPNWVWNGTKYAPRVKSIQPEPYSDLLKVLADKLGLDYDDLWKEVIAAKEARRKNAV